MADKDFEQVYIITGETGGGKTTFLLEMIKKLRWNTLSVAGFAALNVPDENRFAVYKIIDLASGKVLPLASRRFHKGWEAIGNFYFNPAGIEMGKNILEHALIYKPDIFVIDEIGPFELEGKVWSEGLTQLLLGRYCPVLLVVREKLVKEVIQTWNLHDAEIFKIGQLNPDQAAKLIMSGNAGAVN